LNLPNSWFWDQKRVIANNYTVSNTNPIYFYQEVKPRTREETYLNKLKEKLDFDHVVISRAYALISPDLAMAVSIARNVQSSRMKTSPKQFYTQSWRSFPDFEMRQEIIKWFEKKWNEWEWNKNLTLDSSPVLPVVHGTDMSLAWKIAQGGFASLSTHDGGFYGKGIYFSTSAKYVIPYFGRKKSPAILICLTIPGNAYPVTEQPNSNKIMGQPLKNGYNSHYAVTTKRGLPFTKQAYENNETKYDEMVIGQESQVVPVFLLKIKKDCIENLFGEWYREVPMGYEEDPLWG